MNDRLHMMGFIARDKDRGSNVPAHKDPQASVPQSKVLLKQNKPR
jgi:hypothetical protein